MIHILSFLYQIYNGGPKIAPKPTQKKTTYWPEEKKYAPHLNLLAPFGLEIAATLLIHPLLVGVAGISRAKGASLQGEVRRSYQGNDGRSKRSKLPCKLAPFCLEMSATPSVPHCDITARNGFCTPFTLVQSHQIDSKMHTNCALRPQVPHTT